MADYFTITIEPSGKNIFVKPGESILTAGLRQAFDLPFSCQEGECATCMGRLLQGEIDYPDTEPYALTSDEIEQGHVLTCCSTPKSDCIIWLEGITAPEDLPNKTITCKLVSAQALNSDTTKLVIAIPEDEHMAWLAGQYVYLDNRVAGDSRPYTIAGHDGNHLRFYIQHSVEYNAKMLAQITAAEHVTINGPHGNCIYRREPELPLLLIAGGTGFAQIAALMQAMIKDEYQHPIHLFWGTKTAADFHSKNLIKQWQNALPQFQYTPAVSENNSNWDSAVGLVHSIVTQTYPDCQEHRAYVSGSPDMVSATYKSLLDHNLPENLFMSDLKPKN